MKKIEPVNNNLTELLNNINFNSEQERKKAILDNLNKKSVREGWDEHAGPPKSRPQWSQQARLDSAVLNRQSVMNDSCLTELSVQGQGINISNANAPVRSQWGAAPKGTIISVLERANVYDHTMASTINDETSDISLKGLANRMNPTRKNETYVVSTPAARPVIEKPMENDLIVEDLIKADRDELVECLTTGRFDATNKRVRKSNLINCVD